MSFQDIKPIENPEDYVKICLRRADKKASLMREKNRGSKKSRIDKSRDVEITRINVFSDTLSEKMQSIVKDFPSLDQLTDFYVELVKLVIGTKELKKSLASIDWAKKQIRKFNGVYTGKIIKCKDLSKISSYRREMIGRSNSLMKQIKKHLEFAEFARKQLKEFPSIKSDHEIIAIAGFPNVGKTTLLKSLTGSDAEINEYAFTTKRLNIGYIKDKKIQFLDTPGTLNRKKMNYIELQADLALKMLASRIIYVFDITEPYPLKDQEKLLKNIKKLKKEVLLYLSKTDLLDKKDIEDFKKKYDILSFDELKKILIK